MKVQPRRQQRLRCPVCFTALRPGPRVAACPNDHARVHASCLALSARCPAAGCHEELQLPSRGLSWPRARPWASAAALLLTAAMILARAPLSDALVEVTGLAERSRPTQRELVRAALALMDEANPAAHSRGAARLARLRDPRALLGQLMEEAPGSPRARRVAAQLDGLLTRDRARPWSGWVEAIGVTFGELRPAQWHALGAAQCWEARRLTRIRQACYLRSADRTTREVAFEALSADEEAVAELIPELIARYKVADEVERSRIRVLVNAAPAACAPLLAALGDLPVLEWRAFEPLLRHDQALGAEARERAWEAFFKADPSMRPVLARRLVTSVNGRLSRRGLALAERLAAANTCRPALRELRYSAESLGLCIVLLAVVTQPGSRILDGPFVEVSLRGAEAPDLLRAALRCPRGRLRDELVKRYAEAWWRLAREGAGHRRRRDVSLEDQRHPSTLVDLLTASAVEEVESWLDGGRYTLQFSSELALGVPR